MKFKELLITDLTLQVNLNNMPETEENGQDHLRCAGSRYLYKNYQLYTREEFLYLHNCISEMI